MILCGKLPALNYLFHLGDTQGRMMIKCDIPETTSVMSVIAVLNGLRTKMAQALAVSTMYDTAYVEYH
jgi:hypothetical protein